MNENDERWAVFWCSLLQPLLFGEVADGEATRILKEVAATEYIFPDGRRKKPSLSTLRRKWKLYREGGFEALARRRRSDRGRSRKFSEEMLRRAVELKTEQPLRSDETINRFLEHEFGRTIPKSTLYRHLRRAGATRLKLGVTQTKVRCRWTRDTTHALWLGDFEEGPFVFFGDRVVPTHLCAWIDCHSRYIVEARYYFRQTLDVLIDSLLRAWAQHGASRELYVDNAKVYHSRALEAACYALNIRRIYRTAGDPPPGGLIERFFETAQGQFETEVRAGEILTLKELNRALSAWLDVSYHQREHSDTGEPPAKRYQRGLTVTRSVDLDRVMAFFLKKVPRTVDRTFADVRLEGLFFRVNPDWRGDRVEVRYDPFAPLEKVFIYTLDGEYLGTGKRYQREKDAHEPGTPPADRGQPAHNYLELLLEQHERKLEAESAGIDYRKLPAEGKWPFAEFVKTLAGLLGKPGGLSAFNADELERLQKLFGSVECDEPLLREAVAAAEPKTLPEIAYHLKRLADKRLADKRFD